MSSSSARTATRRFARSTIRRCGSLKIGVPAHRRRQHAADARAGQAQAHRQRHRLSRLRRKRGQARRENHRRRRQRRDRRRDRLGTAGRLFRQAAIRAAGGDARVARGRTSMGDAIDAVHLRNLHGAAPAGQGTARSDQRRDRQSARGDRPDPR